MNGERCTHDESLYGRCTACGKTWDEQAEDRAVSSQEAPKA